MKIKLPDLFCSIFHRWTDWEPVATTSYQIRWCQGCNKQQKRIIVTKVKKVRRVQYED